ncbi:glycosyltransferase family 2 protein [Candidatus Woesearchaeota archaeon]|nr:glycosyltransferase family 2 protein [Candidatus Woesearchaeota archaeon]
MEISIILPALNEEKSIGKTIREIKDVLSKGKIKFEIIVVDSDSRDKTAMIARSLGAKVVNEPIKGYGNALRRGFREAKGRYIIMYDPDGTYDANTLPLMIKT